MLKHFAYIVFYILNSVVFTNCAQVAQKQKSVLLSAACAVASAATMLAVARYVTSCNLSEEFNAKKIARTVAKQVASNRRRLTSKIVAHKSSVVRSFGLCVERYVLGQSCWEVNADICRLLSLTD